MADGGERLEPDVDVVKGRSFVGTCLHPNRFASSCNRVSSSFLSTSVGATSLDGLSHCLVNNNKCANASMWFEHAHACSLCLPNRSRLHAERYSGSDYFGIQVDFEYAISD